MGFKFGACRPYISGPMPETLSLEACLGFRSWIRVMDSGPCARGFGLRVSELGNLGLSPYLEAGPSAVTAEYTLGRT